MTDPVTLGADSVGVDAGSKLAMKTGVMIDAAPDAGLNGTGEHAHQKHGHLSHHEIEEGKEGSKSRSRDGRKTPLREAFEASKGKLLSGAIMFAGFGILLTTMTSFAGAILGTAMAGALWMGGNEFVKTYREAKSDEHSRLNRTIDKVKDAVANAKDRIQDKAHRVEDAVVKEVAELGAVAGVAASHLGTTSFHAAPQVESAAPSVNQTVQRILAEGPKSRTSAIIESRSPEATAAQRLEQQADRLLDQAHISI